MTWSVQAPIVQSPDQQPPPGSSELMDLDRLKMEPSSSDSIPPADLPSDASIIQQHFLRFTDPSFDSPATCCVGCGYPIRDQFMLKVNEEVWHESCLRCFACQQPLSGAQSCYAKDGHIYCRDDHQLQFSRKCTRCLLPLAPSDLVYRCMHATYHTRCFTCAACQLPFKKGDEYLFYNGEIVCRADYHRIMCEQSALQMQPGPALLASSSSTPLHSLPSTSVDKLFLPEPLPIYPLVYLQSLPVVDAPPSAPPSKLPKTEPTAGYYEEQDAHRKTPKRPRTILNAQQRKQFKAAFDRSAKPCRKVREQLAKETNLSVRVVQVWFQNQRAKMKKMQRKEEKNRSQSGGDSEGKSLDGNKSDSEDEMESDGEVDTSSPQLAHLIGGLDPLTNPIDKLYNMHNTYFSF